MAIRVQQFPSKRSEFTYGIQKAALASIVPDNCVSLITNQGDLAGIWRELDENVIGARRSYIDKTEVLRQFIAYTLMFRRNGQFGHIEFGVYLRNKKNGEVKLASALSLGIGGHTERKDVHEYSEDNMGSFLNGDGFDNTLHGTGEIDVESTMYANYQREALEEVTFSDAIALNSRLLGFVSDSKDQPGYIGNTHVGLIRSIEVLNDGDFEMAEEMNDRIGWFTPRQLMNMRDGVVTGGDEGDAPVLPAFEPWSKMLIDNISVIASMLLGSETLTVSDEVFDKITAMGEGEAEPNEALTELLKRETRWAKNTDPNLKPVIDPKFHGQSGGTIGELLRNGEGQQQVDDSQS